MSYFLQTGDCVGVKFMLSFHTSPALFSSTPLMYSGVHVFVQELPFSWSTVPSTHNLTQWKSNLHTINSSATSSISSLSHSIQDELAAEEAHLSFSKRGRNRVLWGSHLSHDRVFYLQMGALSCLLKELGPSLVYNTSHSVSASFYPFLWYLY